MNISFFDSAAAVAFAVLLALTTTPASAQCDPSSCTNPFGGFRQNRLPPQAQAEPLCLFDPVVWVNTKSHVYHVASSRRYGHTRYGAYMCESEAKSAGNRAAAALTAVGTFHSDATGFPCPERVVYLN